MFITDQYITFADAYLNEGADYGTGYYLTQRYSNGSMEYFGPYDYEEDAHSITSPNNNTHFLIMNNII